MTRLLLETDVNAICRNAEIIRSRLKPETKMLCVVKADAYGHGAVQVAGALLREKLADAFAVATPEEGETLRHSGIKDVPIVVLGVISDAGAALISAQNDLSQAVTGVRDLRMMNEAGRQAGKIARVHLAIDTGMSRIGVRDDETLKQTLAELRQADHLYAEGMFTHFCAADTDAAFTRKQNESFRESKKIVNDAGVDPICHVSASTALLNRDYAWDMVRAGIALYGTGVEELEGVVRPAQRLISHPIAIRSIRAGDTVGYGRTFTAARDSVIMTVPCGYGDGYPRILSGKADVLVNGKRAPIAGRVCMDMLMADITDIPGVNEDSTVTLLGSDGSETITPSELADKAQTIPYEIMLGFSGRVKRSWKY